MNNNKSILIAAVVTILIVLTCITLPVAGLFLYDGPVVMWQSASYPGHKDGCQIFWHVLYCDISNTLYCYAGFTPLYNPVAECVDFRK